MTAVRADKRPQIAAGTGVAVLLGVTFPLYAEFFEPGFGLWNAFLIAFLVGVVIAAAFLARFFAAHAGEIGEARFDTTNKGDPRG